MFHKIISATPFTEGVAAGFFANIVGDSYRGDVSFVSVLRAMLKRRIPEDEIVSFEHYDYSNSADSTEELDAQKLFEQLLSPSRWYDATHRVTLWTVSDNAVQEKMFARLDDRENGFEKLRPEFRCLNDLQVFTSTAMQARFYLSESSKRVVIVVGSCNSRRFHLLGALTPRYLPWLFAEMPIDPMEQELFKSMTFNQPGDFEDLIGKLFQRYDLRDYTIKNVLGNFERRSRGRQLETKERDRDHLMEEIRMNENAYTRLVRDLEETNFTIDGIRAAIEGYGDCESSELVDYFRCNKSLVPLSSGDRSFSFIVKGYIDSFDPDMYETMVKNPGSHLNRGYTVETEVFKNTGNRKMLMDALFSDTPLMRVKSCAYYELDITGNVNVHSHYHYPADCKDRIPNPHLQYHACLGDHRRHIQEALRKGDIVRAVEQCVSSAKSINIGESASMTYFLPDVFNSKENIIELCDGSMSLTPEEALEYIKAIKKKEEQADG